MNMAAKKTENKPKTYVVYTKDPAYCGVGAGGVQFAYGRAEINDGWVLDWYRERGYKMELKTETEEPAKTE